MKLSPRYFLFLGEALETLPEEQRRLGLLIGVAALLHALVFFSVRLVAPPEASLMEIVSPQAALMLAPAVAVPAPTLANPGFWSQINDPSLVIYPPRLLNLAGEGGTAPAPEPAPLWPGDGPSEAATVALSPALQFLPDRIPPLPERARADLAVAAPASQTFHFSLHPVPSVPSLDHTAVVWNGALASRAPSSWPLPSPPGGLLAESGTTVLSLAVDASGAVAYVLVEQSAGRAEVDALAADSARRLRFRPAPGSRLVWGRVTVFWQFVPPSAP